MGLTCGTNQPSVRRHTKSPLLQNEGEPTHVGINWAQLGLELGPMIDKYSCAFVLKYIEYDLSFAKSIIHLLLSFIM